MVKVYSKENCVSCKVTKNYLKMRGVKFEEIDVSENETALNHILELGYKKLPVVEFNDKHWSGHNVNMLSTLSQG